jgi:hypothetical protein
MESNNTNYSQNSLSGRNAKIFYQDTNHMQKGHFLKLKFMFYLLK